MENNEHKISVVINTYNAAAMLEEVIRAAEGFDEVLVCDMESTDDTVAIAERLGARVVTFAKRNYNITHQEGDNEIIADNKNFCNKKNPNNK